MRYNIGKTFAFQASAWILSTCAISLLCSEMEIDHSCPRVTSYHAGLEAPWSTWHLAFFLYWTIQVHSIILIPTSSQIHDSPRVNIGIPIFQLLHWWWALVCSFFFLIKNCSPEANNCWQEELKSFLIPIKMKQNKKSGEVKCHKSGVKVKLEECHTWMFWYQVEH